MEGEIPRDLAPPEGFGPGGEITGVRNPWTPGFYLMKIEMCSVLLDCHVWLAMSE